MKYNVQKTEQHLFCIQHFVYIATACTIRYGWQAKPQIIVVMKLKETFCHFVWQITEYSIRPQPATSIPLFYEVQV